MKVSILIPNDQQQRAKYFSSIQRGIEQSKMSNLAHVKKMTRQKSKKDFEVVSVATWVILFVKLF